MTGPEFKQWVEKMKTAGLAKSQAECARLLGITPKSACNMVKNGCDRRTELAGLALYHRLDKKDE